MKATHGLAFAGILLCGGIALFRISHDSVPPRTQAPEPSSSEVARSLTPALIPSRVVPHPARDVRPESPGPRTSKVAPVTEKNAAPVRTAPQSPGRKGKDPVRDPLARQALALVGMSEAAEAYWVQAINDPSLSAQEREDLIEDLNEDGLSDPKRPGPEDLPLILSRLELIELLAPQAMDEVNADAFMEAYKDLVNLANISVGGGDPLR